MAYLPQPPYRLKPDYARSQLGKGALFLVVMLGLGAWLAGYGVVLLRDVLAEATVWHRGATATAAQVEGEVKTSRFVIREYDLRVVYADEAGAEHEVKHEVTSLFEEADTAADPVVKYDPADRRRIAVSWTAQLSWGPVVWSMTMLCIGAVMVLGGLVTIATARRNVRSARACAAAGREVEVRVLTLAPIGRSQKLRLVYEAPATVTARAAKREVVLDWPPILVGPPEARRALALVAPDAPNHPTFPRADLHPYEATPEQVEALAQAVGRAA
jgi:hypothetical protein